MAVTSTNQVGDCEVTFLQINLQHGKASTSLLCADLIKLHTHIALIQEPWINNKQIKGLNDKRFSVIADSRSERPRTCIAISNNLPKTVLARFISQDLVAVKVTLNNGKGHKVDTVIASAYLPFDSEDIPHQRFKDLVSFCQNKKLPLVIGCDANAHHECWGSTNTNKRGSELFEYSVANNLLVANLGSQPTFSDFRREEVIDFTFTNALAVSLIDNWHVITDNCLSDHNRIL